MTDTETGVGHDESPGKLELAAGVGLTVLLGPIAVVTALRGQPPGEVNWPMLTAGLVGCLMWGEVIFQVINLVA